MGLSWWWRALWPQRCGPAIIAASPFSRGSPTSASAARSTTERGGGISTSVTPTTARSAACGTSPTGSAARSRRCSSGTATARGGGRHGGRRSVGRRDGRAAHRAIDEDVPGRVDAGDADDRCERLGHIGKGDSQDDVRDRAGGEHAEHVDDCLASDQQALGLGGQLGAHNQKPRAPMRRTVTRWATSKPHVPSRPISTSMMAWRSPYSRTPATRPERWRNVKGPPPPR